MFFFINIYKQRNSRKMGSWYIVNLTAPHPNTLLNKHSEVKEYPFEITWSYKDKALTMEDALQEARKLRKALKISGASAMIVGKTISDTLEMASEES